MFAFRCRTFGCIEIGIRSAGKLRVVPVAAPLERVAVHVVKPPSIGRIFADLGSLAERWSWLAAVVGLPFEVGLMAAEAVAERRRGRRPSAAGIFPLRFGR